MERDSYFFNFCFIDKTPSSCGIFELKLLSLKSTFFNFKEHKR